MRIRSLAESESRAESCTACPLWEGAQTLVYDDGSHNADLMLIGEAPGRQEDEQGKPFVGDVGQLLNGMLREVGVRREDVYVANVIKHRPPKNRNPHAGEIRACLPWLAEQIQLVDPKFAHAPPSTSR